MRKNNKIKLFSIIFIVTIIALLIILITKNTNMNKVNENKNLDIEMTDFVISVKSYLNSEPTINTGFISLSKESLSNNIGKYIYVGDSKEETINIFNYNSNSEMINKEIENIKSYINNIDYKKFSVIGIIYYGGYEIIKTEMNLVDNIIKVKYNATTSNIRVCYVMEPEKELYLYKVSNEYLKNINENNIKFEITANEIVEREY